MWKTLLDGFLVFVGVVGAIAATAYFVGALVGIGIRGARWVLDQ